MSRSRAAVARPTPVTAPRTADRAAAVGAWARQGGQPLPPTLRRQFEPFYGADFSSVRIHDDARSHAAARSAHALAFTVGNHVHFRRGQFQPDRPAGLTLLAHELAHTLQQRGASGVAGSARSEHEADTAAARVTQGQRVEVRPGTATGPQFKLDISDFEGGNFSLATLQSYLGRIQAAQKIEDHGDSDDMAREIVKRWRKDTNDFILDPPTKVLLIKEMQSGFTGNDDERAILNLLEFSTHADVEAMFSPGGLDPDDLDSDFQGDEEDELRAFYDREFKGGRKAALKGQRDLQPEKLQTLASPYKSAALRSMIAERVRRIERTIRDRPVDERPWTSQELARADAADVYLELQKLTPAERDLATADMSADRVKREAQANLLDDSIAQSKDKAAQERMTRDQVVLRAEVTLLDFAMQPVFKDVAIASPKKKADFQKLTTPLDAAKKAEARAAITPVTQAEAKAEATGVAPPPPEKFTKTRKGEKDYDVKIAERIPPMIKEMHDTYGKARGEKEHKDKKLTHQLSELQVIANQSKAEVDLVFGQFYNAASFKAFQADKRDATGKLTKKGNLHDLWADEQDKLKADPSYQKGSAKFWLFYLIQNDSAVQKINYDHNASPSFGDDSKALNDEAKLIRKVGDPFVTSDSKRLFEIGRGWDAVQSEHEVSIQLFKNPDPTQDRVFLWDMFFTLMHEYLHSLSNKAYSDYADKLGGEHSTEGNTLIEGVDSLFTEIAWTNAVKRASLKEVREKVEPDAVKAGDPFDANLLPTMPHRRYDTYSQALKLVKVVGIRNLYAAYFQGRVDLIGKK
jgi:hypothetical protein